MLYCKKFLKTFYVQLSCRQFVDTEVPNKPLDEFDQQIEHNYTYGYNMLFIV